MWFGRRNSGLTFERLPSGCAAYNNTVTWGAYTSAGAAAVLIQAGSTTANVKNNLGYAPSASAPVLLLDSGTGTARGSNSSDA